MYFTQIDFNLYYNKIINKFTSDLLEYKAVDRK